MNLTTRRDFLKSAGAGLAALSLTGRLGFAAAGNDKPPNILVAIADDWSWPHASIAGARVIKTPVFDRIAREGVLFRNAFVSAPSCTPSRASLLTGQWFWRLKEAADLYSTLLAEFPVYPDLLEAEGYYVGYSRKGWEPGDEVDRKRNPAGPQFRNFPDFLKRRPKEKPFCFWFGSTDPHRPYRRGTGIKSGMDPAAVEVPPHLVDHKWTRGDICDYYFEVQRFDREVGERLRMLEENDELENTIVIMTSDNGMPFARCKSNLYDLGTHVPLAVRWGKRIKPGRVVDDFVSLCDLAPTFLEAAGLKPTKDMTGRSLMPVLTSDKSGTVDAARDHVLTGKERHFPYRGGKMAGYPMRAIRTEKHLYIRNFKPDRWPAGDPLEPKSGRRYGDVDDGPAMWALRSLGKKPEFRHLHQLSYGKRPAEELYDLKADPAQMNNVADKPKYAAVKAKLSARLVAELVATRDPRILGKGDAFDTYPWRRKPW